MTREELLALIIAIQDNPTESAENSTRLADLTTAINGLYETISTINESNETLTTSNARLTEANAQLFLKIPGINDIKNVVEEDDETLDKRDFNDLFDEKGGLR